MLQLCIPVLEVCIFFVKHIKLLTCTHSDVNFCQSFVVIWENEHFLMFNLLTSFTTRVSCYILLDSSSFSTGFELDKIVLSAFSQLFNIFIFLSLVMNQCSFGRFYIPVTQMCQFWIQCLISSVSLPFLLYEVQRCMQYCKCVMHSFSFITIIYIPSCMCSRHLLTLLTTLHSSLSSTVWHSGNSSWFISVHLSGYWPSVSRLAIYCIYIYIYIYIYISCLTWPHFLSHH